jgi:hypothetical protein
MRLDRRRRRRLIAINLFERGPFDATHRRLVQLSHLFGARKIVCLTLFTIQMSMQKKKKKSTQKHTQFTSIITCLNQQDIDNLNIVEQALSTLNDKRQYQLHKQAIFFKKNCRETSI